MPRVPDPNLIAAFERVQRMHERRRMSETDDPLVWIVVGVALVAIFVLAMAIRWFPALTP